MTLLGLALIAIGACQQPKTKYIVKYQKIKISCQFPDWPDFEDVEKHKNKFDRLLAERRNANRALKALEEWENYKKCVDKQTN